MFIIPFRSFLAGLELNLHSHMLSQKRLNYALSYDFEIFKGMSHNLELLMKLSENVWFVWVYKKGESATAIRAGTVLKGG